MSSDSTKSAHGYEARKIIEPILSQCQDRKLIGTPEYNVRLALPGYQEAQFNIPFLVPLQDSRQYLLIYSTTSFRSDRIKIHEWNILFSKRILAKDAVAVLVYPSNVSGAEAQAFRAYRHKIQTRQLYSSFDEVIPDSALKEYVIKLAEGHASQGSLDNVRGTAFEDDVERIMTSAKNLEKAKTGSPVITGDSFHEYLEMCDCIGLDLSKVTRIDSLANELAESREGKGKPKTDVALNVVFDDSSERMITISCKQSRKDVVTLHEYPASRFISVLNIPSGSGLASLLLEFQATGGETALGESKSKLLTQLLQPYLPSLIRWVYGGASQKPILNAEYLFSRHIDSSGRSRIYCHKIDDCLEFPASGQFGTPFRWTYASGKKGVTIQLKGPYF